MPYEEDFAPDVEGLQAALDRLVKARTASGAPHVGPDVALDLPAALPEQGLGGRAALERSAVAALEHVSRLDHPGFFAETRM